MRTLLLLLVLVTPLGESALRAQTLVPDLDAAQRASVDNLEAFARLYALVRFFHPSDEASDVDWARLAVLGAERASVADSPQALADAPTDPLDESRREALAGTAQYHKQVLEAASQSIERSPAGAFVEDVVHALNRIRSEDPHAGWRLRAACEHTYAVWRGTGQSVAIPDSLDHLVVEFRRPPDAVHLYADDMTVSAALPSASTCHWAEPLSGPKPLRMTVDG